MSKCLQPPNSDRVKSDPLTVLTYCVDVETAVTGLAFRLLRSTTISMIYRAAYGLITEMPGGHISNYLE